MLEDDFKKIEEFLQNPDNSALNNFEPSTTNSESELFKKFEKIVDELIANQFTENSKENFLALHELMFHSYGDFNTANEGTIKDFGVAVLVLKHVILKLNSVANDTILSEKDRALYIHLMKLLVNALQEEAKRNINFFQTYIEYLENSKILFEVDD